MVAAADRRLAERAASRGWRHDCARMRRSIKACSFRRMAFSRKNCRRICAATETGTDPAPGQNRDKVRPDARADHRCRLDPGSPGGNRGPRHSRSLGRRSFDQLEKQPYRRLGRAQHALSGAGQGPWAGRRQCRRRPDPPSRAPAAGTDGLADLGSRNRVGLSPDGRRHFGRQRLFLRLSKPLAARKQRERQWSAAPIFPKGNGAVRSHPKRPGSGSATPRHETSENLWFSDAG